uniref:Uncharacterized protein LOC113796602 n=1 Tax=Dermatophagoides pteronyssinus TaxID=6956 RepID=A0A6P6YBP4_DERPT
IIVVLFIISPFIYTNGIYSRVAQFPQINQQCCNVFMNWLSRQQQFQITNSNNQKFILSRLLLRDTIKTNLFVQTMTENQFGISCGQIFFITKFKYVELFILNFIMIILFY